MTDDEIAEAVVADSIAQLEINPHTMRRMAEAHEKLANLYGPDEGDMHTRIAAAYRAKAAALTQ